jgi:hypothetical protein
VATKNETIFRSKNLKLKQMKKLLVAFSLLLAMSFTTKSAQAQVDDVNTIIGNLIAVNIQDVQLDITTGDITVVNVENVLNNADIQILKDFVITVEIDNVLNNLLREADIISNNQIVVGVLSNGTFLILDQKANTKPRKK